MCKVSASSHNLKSLTQKTKNWCNYTRNNMNCTYFLGEKKRKYVFLMLQIGHPTLLSDPQIIFSEPRLTFSNLHCYLLFCRYSVDRSFSKSYCCIFYAKPINTQPDVTLFLSKSMWTRPQGSQGCQKIAFFFTNKTVEFLH